MIELFAIINEGEVMEIYAKEKKKKFLALLQTFIKEIRNKESKLIREILISNYHVYYFEQDNFLFVLATQISTRSQRMKNYLRVVADIFYQNYDERKFHIVLNKIMDEINKIEFGTKKPQMSMQDEETGLMNSHFATSKKKINKVIEEREDKSKRANIVFYVLVVCIVLLLFYYFSKKL